MQRRPRLRDLPINRMIPNVLTILALCAGLTAIRFGLQERWEAAVIAIVVAGIFDGLDGRIARMLGQTSKFGAELDSLSDIVCFGVAPAVLVFFWSLHEAGSVGWAAVMLFAVCCALRLARFNTRLEKPDRPVWANRFFTGAPAPAGAGLAIWPMIMSFGFQSEVFRSPIITGIVLVAVAALMVSQLPTFSLKHDRIPRHFVLPILLAVGLLAGFFASAPWLTLTAVGLAYIVSIPFSYRMYRRLRAASQMIDDEEEDGAFISVGDESDVHDRRGPKI
ncbi:MAG: CDP-diacylglycerol--serine O-phosphatidyltransferase [Alphaproteobacteria bacterium]|nr:CDP-diacylglycerol--serine O-phosphatidyltransferase [Alphaproteobacteria bacterium]